MSMIKHYPDVLDCIANLSNDEVFTPPTLVNKVLDLLPIEVWSNPNLKWLDPSCKTGVFLREIAKRLWFGLADKIKDDNQRKEHIFKNMLYGIAITELTFLSSKRSLYYSKDANSENSVFQFKNNDGNIFYENIQHTFENNECKFCSIKIENLKDRNSETNELYAYNFIHKKLNTIFKEENMKFDVIIGNPPYQTDDGGHGASASPLYHLFIENAKELNPKYLSMIIPARWYAGGKGLEGFRDTMLNDKRISKLVDFTDSKECFPGVDVKGGICYFLWDRDHNGKCLVTNKNNEKETSIERDLNQYEIFVRFNSAISILNKVKNHNENNLSTVVSSRKPFGFPTNFMDYKKNKFNNSTFIFARGEQGFVDNNKILKNTNLIDKYKVLLTIAAEGDGKFPNKIIGQPIVTEKGSCCTETYLVANSFDNLYEAKNFEQYLKTKFLRFLIALKKHTQHLTKDKFEFVPDLPMSSSWTDEILYRKYNLTQEEIDFIESMIKPM